MALGTQLPGAVWWTLEVVPRGGRAAKGHVFYNPFMYLLSVECPYLSEREVSLQVINFVSYRSW